MKAVTAQQMRELDAAATRDFGILSIILMENAALGVLEECRGESFRIFCGRGNNGGDGFCLARHLFLAGKEVEVVTVCGEDAYTGDAKTNFEIIKKLGVMITPVEKADPGREFDMAVDALLGTGCKKAPEGAYLAAVRLFNQMKGAKLCVDMPTGVCADTGAGVWRSGQRRCNGNACPSENWASNLSGGGICRAGSGEGHRIPAQAVDQAGILTEVLEETLPARRPNTIKEPTAARRWWQVRWDGGAAHLCSAACVKGGAGLVTVFCPKSILGAVSVKNTEAMAFGLPDDGAALGVGAFAAMKEQLLASDAILVGCGLRAVPGVKEAVKGILSLKKPCVLDADAINVLDKDASLDGCVITPHPGEMARLLGVSVSQVEQNRLAVAADFAKKSGAVVVLKGARTVISAPDGKTRINVLGNAGMATGGAGDVLAGAGVRFPGSGVFAL